MKLLFYLLPFTLLAACQTGSLNERGQTSKEIDSCTTALIYPNAKLVEQMVESGFSGELNNYWGDDTTKLDFKHVFKEGKLIQTYFYYENGKVSEKYSFKCQSLHGNIKFFHENGQLNQVIPFEYGFRNGIGIMYDSLGVETSRVIFKNDSIVENSEIPN